LTSLKQNETFPTQWWEQPPFAPYDVDDEPYLVHMGIRIKLNEPIRIETNAASVESSGRYMCDILEGQTCQAPADDGVPFYGVYYPDVLDLANGSQPFELIGSVEVMFEKDSPPGATLGVTAFFQGLTSLLNAAIMPLLLNGGTFPTDPQGLINFLSVVLPPVLATLIAFIGTNVLGAILGADQIIGFAPMFFFAVGGTLAAILKATLPSLLVLVNQYLAQQPNSPFPDGLPITLGVMGQVAELEFGAEFQTPFTHYRTVHTAKAF
ncbi:MAG TPA: hypothetical protein VJM33_17025, partial [Microthrixaceae bacterium]|nr:hypothetical protein [Microthrixaceae bacterium]